MENKCGSVYLRQSVETVSMTLVSSAGAVGASCISEKELVPCGCFLVGRIQHRGGTTHPGLVEQTFS